MIEAVKETTGFDFDHIFAMSVVETFSYLTYIKEKRAREAAQIKKLRMRRNG